MYLNTGLPDVEQASALGLVDDAVPLPESGQLFRAIAGHPSSMSPLSEWARELSDLHAALIPSQCGTPVQPTGSDCGQIRHAIGRVVEEIDEWAARYLPRPKSARKHTHSLGEVIAHIARAYAEAWWLVLRARDEEVRHEAWFHTGEAIEGYSEMVKEIKARNLRLPLGSARIQAGESASGMR
ncbi:hypothetical protein [Nocardia sp. NPDC051463]|uniref:hypothetical protein n=1 Tax=Nocardia sp. NPDC051463 TaxID=3154845 RepID=UPI003414DFF9